LLDVTLRPHFPESPHFPEKQGRRQGGNPLVQYLEIRNPNRWRSAKLIWVSIGVANASDCRKSGPTTCVWNLMDPDWLQVLNEWWAENKLWAKAIVWAITALWVFIETARRISAERELREIKRRSSGPYFVVWHLPFDRKVRFPEREIVAPALETSQRVLWLENQEVPRDHEGFVFLMVTNRGERPRAISITNKKERVYCGYDESGGIICLSYPFSRTRYGKKERFKVQFESQNGVVDTHVYLTRHGKRYLKRISPSSVKYWRFW
jgi:hypothetical protein